MSVKATSTNTGLSSFQKNFSAKLGPDFLNCAEISANASFKGFVQGGLETLSAVTS